MNVDVFSKHKHWRYVLYSKGITYMYVYACTYQTLAFAHHPHLHTMDIQYSNQHPTSKRWLEDSTRSSIRRTLPIRINNTHAHAHVHLPRPPPLRPHRAQPPPPLPHNTLHPRALCALGHPPREPPHVAHAHDAECGEAGGEERGEGCEEGVCWAGDGEDLEWMWVGVGVGG